MCFLRLADLTSSIEVIVFPRTYDKARSLLLTDQVILVSGRLEEGEQTPIIIAENISSLHDAIEEPDGLEQTIAVALPHDTDRILLSKIYEILKANPGDLPTYLILTSTNGSERKIPVPFGVSKSFDLERELTLLGCQLLA